MGRGSRTGGRPQNSLQKGFTLLEALLVIFTGAVLLWGGMAMYKQARKSAAHVDESAPRTAEQVRKAFERHELSGRTRPGGKPFLLISGVQSVRSTGPMPLVEVGAGIVCEFPAAARSQIQALAPGSILNARCLAVRRVGKKIHVNCQPPEKIVP